MPKAEENITNLKKEILEAERDITKTELEIIKNRKELAFRKAEQELLIQAGQFLEESLQLRKTAVKILEKLHEEELE